MPECLGKVGAVGPGHIWCYVHSSYPALHILSLSLCFLEGKIVWEENTEDNQSMVHPLRTLNVSTFHPISKCVCCKFQESHVERLTPFRDKTVENGWMERFWWDYSNFTWQMFAAPICFSTTFYNGATSLKETTTVCLQQLTLVGISQLSNEHS